NVIAAVKRESQGADARRMGAHEIVHIAKEKDPVAAVRALCPAGRGADVVIEAVGRPEAWVLATGMVRKGGTVNFFGGWAQGTKDEVDTKRLPYSQITLKATLPPTPGSRRQAFSPYA